MGSKAELYVFDPFVYDEQVVPFLRQLILHADVDRAASHAMDRILPLVDRIKAFLSARQAKLQPTDLAAHCTYLGDDLRLLPLFAVHQELEADANSAAGALRTCRRDDCPARATCPFHVDDRRGQAQVLASLFGALVKETCLSASQFVGSSMNVFHYNVLLQKHGIPLGGELRELMLALGTRGAVIGHALADSDGVHGWLTVAETARLAILLQPLPLPDLAPTFAAMEKIGRKPAHSNGGWDFDELSLCFVKTVATISTREQKAILWGNNVLNWLAPESECKA